MGYGDSVTRKEFTNLKSGDVLMRYGSTTTIVVVDVGTVHAPLVLAQYVYCHNPHLVGYTMWIGVAGEWELMTG
jgi:hypothetical protein